MWESPIWGVEVEVLQDNWPVGRSTDKLTRGSSSHSCIVPECAKSLYHKTLQSELFSLRIQRCGKATLYESKTKRSLSNSSLALYLFTQSQMALLSRGVIYPGLWLDSQQSRSTLRSH